MHDLQCSCCHGKNLVTLALAKRMTVAVSKGFDSVLLAKGSFDKLDTLVHKLDYIMPETSFSSFFTTLSFYLPQLLTLPFKISSLFFHVHSRIPKSLLMFILDAKMGILLHVEGTNFLKTCINVT